MPFIGVNVTNWAPKNGRLPILVLDQLMIVSCDDIITLTVEVVGQRPTDTFEWVQLSGDFVTWLTPKLQQTVTWQQPEGRRDDKTFKVYVNRGRPREVSGEILVSASPRDELMAMSRPRKVHTDVDDRSYRDQESATQARTLPTPLIIDDSGMVLNPERGIAFNFPADAITSPVGSVGLIPRASLDTHIIGYNIYDVTDGGRILVATLGPLENCFFSLPNGRSYRVTTILNMQGNDEVREALGDVAGYYPPPGYLDAVTWEPATINLLQSKTKIYGETTAYDRALTGTSVIDEDTIKVSLLDGRYLYQTATHYTRELRRIDVVDEDKISANLLDGKHIYAEKVVRDMGIGSLG